MQTAAASSPSAPVIRPACEADMAAIQRIYAHAVLHGLATFELEPPDTAEMTARWRAIRAAGYPYLAAVEPGEGGALLGYAYASAFRPRPAYRFAVENSVYVDPALHRRGAGRALLAGLIAACEAGPWRQMIAVIGDSANAASIGLHAALGFRHAGLLAGTGFKFGRWVDSVYMQRPLGPGAGTPPAG